MHPGRALLSTAGAKGTIIAALCVGCASTSTYARPVRAVQHGFTAAAPVVREAYTGLNDLRREAYFIRLMCDPSREIVEVDEGGEPTPLNHEAFSAESIQARVDVVELLGRYVDRLAALATVDAPADARAADAGTELGANLTRLGARFASLDDERAQEYAGPVGQVAAAVARAVQGQRRAAAVRGAILDAAAPVRRVLELLEADLGDITAHVRAPTLDAVIARCAMHYNSNRSRWSESERRVALDAVRALVGRRAAMRSQDPAGLARAMRDAHEALARFVRGGARDPREAAELANSMETFTRRVDVAARALRAQGAEPR